MPEKQWTKDELIAMCQDWQSCRSGPGVTVIMEAVLSYLTRPESVLDEGVPSKADAEYEEAIAWLDHMRDVFGPVGQSAILLAVGSLRVHRNVLVGKSSAPLTPPVQATGREGPGNRGGMANEKFIPLHQLAQRLGLPAAWLKAEANAGHLPSLLVGRRRLFDADAVRGALPRLAGRQEKAVSVRV
jgi:hypothetical protein